jgi:hypothetical protein
VISFERISGLGRTGDPQGVGALRYPVAVESPETWSAEGACGSLKSLVSGRLVPGGPVLTFSEIPLHLLDGGWM